jgi:2-keto-4-pentenoate hydratase/2-oxohepta-3-ene-1,7-dioic acid hydratase in catechol pathway
MKLVRFMGKKGPTVGIVQGNSIKPISFAGSMENFIGQWSGQQEAVEAALLKEGIPYSEAELLAPVQRPGKIFAIGLNYADHIAESGMEAPQEQVWFTKAVTSINAPYAPVLIPRVSQFVDYEAELVIVIGKRSKNVTEQEAKECVFGFCVGNDVTERAWQHRTHQWSLGKSFDTHAPIGPWITTTDEVGDPHQLDIRCYVNGEKRQDSNTRHLLFNVWQQISQLSQAMTLEPGDLVFTGTPGGVGAAMDPRQFLQEGDVLRTEIDRLGHIECTIAAEE